MGLADVRAQVIDIIRNTTPPSGYATTQYQTWVDSNGAVFDVTQITGQVEHGVFDVVVSLMPTDDGEASPVMGGRYRAELLWRMHYPFAAGTDIGRMQDQMATDCETVVEQILLPTNWGSVDIDALVLEEDIVADVVALDNDAGFRLEMPITALYH